MKSTEGFLGGISLWKKNCFCFILTVFALVRVLLTLQHVPTVQSVFKGAVFKFTFF